MIHYHGTPVGGRRQDAARFLAGRHALVPFPRREDLGVVDADYRGEVKVALINHGDTLVEFKAGDRIAQLIIERCATGLIPEWTDELEDTVRGKGGFGSTGL